MWRIAAVNLVGCIAFGLSAVAAFWVPSEGSVLDLAAANAFTAFGVLRLLIGAILLSASRLTFPSRRRWSRRSHSRHARSRRSRGRKPPRDAWLPRRGWRGPFDEAWRDGTELEPNEIRRWRLRPACGWLRH
jgi:hypothetical protein